VTRAEFAQCLGGGRERRGGRKAVVIEERDPVAFRRAFADAAVGDGAVFLANPDWGTAEREEFEALVGEKARNWDSERGWLMIPTGGSSGRVKLARHDQVTIAAAVDGYCRFFGVESVNAMGVLPLHHVGGLMGWLRCALTGGVYRDGDWKVLRTGPLGEPAAGDWSVSLVETQLKQLLNTEAGRAWLQGFGRVLTGGSALNETVATEARAAGVRCAPGYGMTETMAMVVAQRPAEFLSGGVSGGETLAHAQISVGEDERICIGGLSLFRGYWPDTRADGDWVTADRGVIEADGRVQIWGRVDDVLISGGEKVSVTEVERVLAEFMPAEEFAVVGVPDAKWGQRVVVCYREGRERINVGAIETALAGKLAKFKWPKAYVAVKPWPVNAMGKLNRERLRQLAAGSGELRRRIHPSGERIG